ncbi:hypothetical protein MMC12_008482 [Toensbergia leucococca]|nr:hypothetical protein [Toensbergia leucococca]
MAPLTFVLTTALLVLVATVTAIPIPETTTPISNTPLTEFRSSIDAKAVVPPGWTKEQVQSTEAWSANLTTARLSVLAAHQIHHIANHTISTLARDRLVEARGPLVVSASSERQLRYERRGAGKNQPSTPPTTTTTTTTATRPRTEAAAKAQATIEAPPTKKLPKPVSCPVGGFQQHVPPNQVWIHGCMYAITEDGALIEPPDPPAVDPWATETDRLRPKMTGWDHPIY